MQLLEPFLLQGVADCRDALRVAACYLVKAAQTEQQVLKAVSRMLLHSRRTATG
jgi:hypothetical protein